MCDFVGVGVIVVGAIVVVVSVGGVVVANYH